MDTINIIDNFDQNILMENILISNQKNLLDLVIMVFDKDFATKSVDNELTIEYVKKYFNTLNFINWELFIRLLNLKTSFECSIRYSKQDILKYSSLMYLILMIGAKHLKHSTKLIEFLLKLPKGMIDWEIKTYRTGFNALHTLLYFEKIYSNKSLVNQILESNLFDKKMWDELLNYDDLVIQDISNQITPIDRLIDRCSDELVIRAIDLGIINLDTNNSERNYLYKIKSEKVILYLMEKQLIKLDNDVFYLAVRYNWVQVLEYYFSHGFIDWGILHGPYVMFWLGFYKHYQYIFKVFSQSSKTFLANLEKGLDKYYFDNINFNNEQIDLYKTIGVVDNKITNINENANCENEQAEIYDNKKNN